MKIIKGMGLTLMAVLVLCTTISAQDSKRITAKITEATLFMQGAELTHTAQAQFKKGVNEITIEALSPNIDSNSLRINVGGSAVISTYEYSIDYLSGTRKSPATLQWMLDSINIYKTKLSRVLIGINVNSGLRDHLQTGIAKSISGSETGLGIDELKKTMDYYKFKSEEIQNESRDFEKNRRIFEYNINRLQSQYKQESGLGSKTSGLLKLTLSAPVAGTFPVTVIYYTAAASWTPYYEINIVSTDKPIRISAKSKISQSTGLDWENVKLTLSTAVPSNGKVAPLFSTWMLRQRELTRASHNETAAYAMQNAYSYDESVATMKYSKKALQGRVSGIADSPQPAKKLQPMIIIDGREASQAEFDNIDPSLIKEISTVKDASATSIYGAQAAGGVIVITLKNSMDDFITEESNALNVVYNIDLPYTIPGNGKTQNIDLLTKETPAEYKYYCAPKLDHATFLLAEIPNWQELGLLSGPANITYNETYIGETYIDAASTHEKLALTLGTDKRVVVTRELLRDFSTNRVLGSDVNKVFTYRLTVKNNQLQPVKMVLKEQYPTSTQKNIVAELRVKETTPWSANKEETGVITWEEELAPGESRTYQISYSVKHPQGMLLNL